MSSTNCVSLGRALSLDDVLNDMKTSEAENLRGTHALQYILCTYFYVERIELEELVKLCSNEETLSSKSHIILLTSILRLKKLVNTTSGDINTFTVAYQLIVRALREDFWASTQCIQACTEQTLSNDLVKENIQYSDVPANSRTVNLCLVKVLSALMNGVRQINYPLSLIAISTLWCVKSEEFQKLREPKNVWVTLETICNFGINETQQMSDFDLVRYFALSIVLRTFFIPGKTKFQCKVPDLETPYLSSTRVMDKELDRLAEDMFTVKWLETFKHGKSLLRDERRVSEASKFDMNAATVDAPFLVHYNMSAYTITELEPVTPVFEPSSDEHALCETNSREMFQFSTVDASLVSLIPPDSIPPRNGNKPLGQGDQLSMIQSTLVNTPTGQGGQQQNMLSIDGVSMAPSMLHYNGDYNIAPGQGNQPSVHQPTPLPSINAATGQVDGPQTVHSMATTSTLTTSGDVVYYDISKQYDQLQTVCPNTLNQPVPPDKTCGGRIMMNDEVKKFVTDIVNCNSVPTGNIEVEEFAGNVEQGSPATTDNTNVMDDNVAMQTLLSFYPAQTTLSPPASEGKSISPSSSTTNKSKSKSGLAKKSSPKSATGSPPKSSPNLIMESKKLKIEQQITNHKANFPTYFASLRSIVECSKVCEDNGLDLKSSGTAFPGYEESCFYMGTRGSSEDKKSIEIRNYIFKEVLDDFIACSTQVHENCVFGQVPFYMKTGTVKNVSEANIYDQKKNVWQINDSDLTNIIVHGVYLIIVGAPVSPLMKLIFSTKCIHLASSSEGKSFARLFAVVPPYTMHNPDLPSDLTGILTAIFQEFNPELCAYINNFNSPISIPKMDIIKKLENASANIDARIWITNKDPVPQKIRKAIPSKANIKTYLLNCIDMFRKDKKYSELKSSQKRERPEDKNCTDKRRKRSSNKKEEILAKNMGYTTGRFCTSK